MLNHCILQYITVYYMWDPNSIPTKHTMCLHVRCSLSCYITLCWCRWCYRWRCRWWCPAVEAAGGAAGAAGDLPLALPVLPVICRSGAAEVVLPRWCCRGGAAAVVLLWWCCCSGAAGVVLPRWCCRWRCRSCRCCWWRCRWSAAAARVFSSLATPSFFAERLWLRNVALV